MATATITTALVFPTAADIGGGIVGGGSRFQEVVIAPLMRGFFRSRVVSGFDTLGGTLLSRSINIGLAMIDGYAVSGTGSTPTIALEASRANSNPNRLWLQLVKIAGKVTGVQLATSDTPLVDSVRLMDITTSGTDIIATKDRRPEGRVVWGNVMRSSGQFHEWDSPNLGSGDWYLTAGPVVSVLPAFRVTPIGLVGCSPTSTTLLGVTFPASDGLTREFIAIG